MIGFADESNVDMGGVEGISEFLNQSIKMDGVVIN